MARGGGQDMAVVMFSGHGAVIGEPVLSRPPWRGCGHESVPQGVRNFRVGVPNEKF